MSYKVRDRLWGGNQLTNRLSRLKYHRGHNIHSPYVYSIIRDVFITGKGGQNDVSLDESIGNVAGNKKIAREIARLAMHCEFSRISIDESRGEDLIICSTQCPSAKVYDLACSASKSGTAIAIIMPYRRIELCNKILSENDSTSIDRFSYLILFNNHLPKQHFML